MYKRQEEVVASLAEKKRMGELTAGEESAWRKLVNAILRAWKKLVRKVSGREARMDYRGVDALLTDLGRYVLEGIPAGERMGDMRGASPAFASVGGQAAGDMRAAHEAWEQMRNDMEAWDRQVDGVHSGSIHPRRILTVGRTPAVLQKLGAPALPMTMNQSVLRKIGEGGKHDLPESMIRRLPELMAQPVMVFRSGTQADSLVVLLESVHAGMPVVAAVHLEAALSRRVPVCMAGPAAWAGWLVKSGPDDGCMPTKQKSPRGCGDSPRNREADACPGYHCPGPSYFQMILVG